MAGSKVVAVLGPTASGKSALGLALAERLGGEIVCCDSMQVYAGMDIGTGKPSAAERARVPHHLLDVVRPDQPFNAARWAALAREVLADIGGRGRLAIVVGGTGLYFRALTRGLFEAPPPDPEIRERHRREAEAGGTPVLHARLAAIDPEAAATIRTGDLLRISRALEVYEQTGLTVTALKRQAPPPAAPAAFVIVLDAPLPELRPRIAARVDAMMAAGFLDEVRALRAAGHGSQRPMQSLGYRQLGQHLDGALTLEQAVAETKTATAAYARRQRTWFRKEPSAARIPGIPDADALAREIKEAR